MYLTEKHKIEKSLFQFTNSSLNIARKVIPNFNINSIKKWDRGDRSFANEV